MRQHTTVGWRGDGFRCQKSSFSSPLYYASYVKSSKTFCQVLSNSPSLFVWSSLLSAWSIQHKQMVYWLNQHHLVQEEFRTVFPATNSAQKHHLHVQLSLKAQATGTDERRKMRRPLQAITVNGIAFSRKKSPAFNFIYQQKTVFRWHHPLPGQSQTPAWPAPPV